MLGVTREKGQVSRQFWRLRTEDEGGPPRKAADLYRHIGFVVAVVAVIIIVFGRHRLNLPNPARRCGWPPRRFRRVSTVSAATLLLPACVAAMQSSSVLAYIDHC